jgi:site-specific DNA-adenine methylase
MEIIEFIKEYWVLITFFFGEIAVVWAFVQNIRKGIKCTLRNDILAIFDRCKERKEITHYQLQSIKFSYDVYKKLKGNSFVDDIVAKVNDYKVID